MGLGRSSDPKSDLQRLKDDIFVDTAETPNLDKVANNLGFDRPIFGWHRDDLFRAAVRKLAMTRHTPILALHKLCELVFGPAFTKVGTIAAGQGSPAIVVGTVAETFAITTGVNDALVISSQGLDPIQITLPAGGAVTAAVIATAINNASTILQLTADTVTIASNTYLRLTATGNITGVDSIIRIDNIPTSGAATLGLAAVTHGHNDAGSGTYLVKMDSGFITTDVFPQLASSLYVDEHGPDQEILRYKFKDPALNILALDDSVNFSNNHEKYLPAAASELSSGVSAGTITLNIADATFFPTAAAPIAGVDATFFAVIVDRGGNAEELINIQQRAGLVLTTGTELQFDHEISESVEVTFNQDITPTIDTDTAAGVAQLTLDDSGIFPKSEFTVVVGKGTENEETFWISENDFDGNGSTGTPNTLVIDGTQQSDAPSVTQFTHYAGVTVLPAQLQLKGARWIISEARGTGEIVIALLEENVISLDTNALAHAYLHEEIEPSSKNSETDIADVTILKSIFVGEDSIRIALDDLHKLWGGPDVPTGPTVQNFQDIKYLNRIVEIERSGIIERKLLTHVKQSVKLIEIQTGNVLAGYNAGDTILQLDQACMFINEVPPFDVRINRGQPNEESKTVSAIDFTTNQVTLSAGLTNGHCSYDDLGTPADAQGNPVEIFELDDAALGVSLGVSSPFETAFELSGIVVRIVNTASDNFLYAPSATDARGRSPETDAENLQDGGWLPTVQRQNPQNGKFWGYFTHEPGDNQPRSIKTGFPSPPAQSATYPEAIFEIPAPTEILGYCDDIDGVGFVGGTIPGEKSFIVILDAQRWPGYAYPYPAKLGQGTPNAEIVNVARRNAAPGGLPSIPGIGPPFLTTFVPGILELLSPTTRTHEGRAIDGTPGDLAVLRVEQILLDTNAIYFPTASGTAVFDFGFNSQESFDFLSRNGSALILNDHEFEFQHPVTSLPWDDGLNPEFGGMPLGQATIHLVNKNFSFDADGYDHPIHLPGDPSGILLGIGSGVAIVDYVRAAGIKISVEILSQTTVSCPSPNLLIGAYEDWPVGSEGQTARAPSGEPYRYNVTIGRWIPEYWYGVIDTDVAVVGTFTGAGTPGSETSDTPPSPADWTVNTFGAGTLTTSGGYYLADITAAADTANLELDPAAGTTSVGLICRAEVLTAVTGADDEEVSHIGISLSTGEDKQFFVNLALSSGSDVARIVDSSNAAYSGSKIVPVDFDKLTSTDRMIEVYFDSTTTTGKAEVFVNHYLIHTVPVATLTDSLSAMRCMIGDNSSGGGRDVQIKSGIQFRLA